MENCLRLPFTVGLTSFELTNCHGTPQVVDVEADRYYDPDDFLGYDLPLTAPMSAQMAPPETASTWAFRKISTDGLTSAELALFRAFVKAGA